MAATATETKTTAPATAAAVAAPVKAEPTQSTALARPAEARIAGTYHDAREVDSRLTNAGKKAHLVSPATTCGALPEGCGVALSYVEVDVERETYAIPGSGARGLSKVALDRIAAAAGLSWDPHMSRRLDNASHPYFCHYKAVGRYRGFDGTETIVQGEKVMDLREGSAVIDGLVSRKMEKENLTRSAARVEVEGQVRELRMHLLSHAETKARLRAVRSLGIRTSYAREELTKPFVVARIMFTGQTQDPVLRQEFGRMTASAFLFGGRAMYGDPSHGPALPAPTAPPSLAEQGYAPPSMSVPDYDDVPETPTSSAVATVRDAAPARSSSSGRAFTIPGGRDKGKPLSEADASSLTWWAKKISDGLEDGSAKYPDKDRALLVALREEQARRAAPKADAKPVDVVNGEVDESRLPREPGDEEQPPLPLNGY